MMSAQADLREARKLAETLVSEEWRKYLFVSGRLLPALLGVFCDEMTKALGEELPPLPRRLGRVKSVRLDELTSTELGTLYDIVRELVTERLRGLMRDPALPDLLVDFWTRLSVERMEREGIQADFGKAQVS